MKKIEGHPMQKVGSLEGVSLLFENANYVPHMDLDGLFRNVATARVSRPRVMSTQLTDLVSNFMPQLRPSADGQLQNFMADLNLPNGVAVDINIANTYDGYGLADVLPVEDGFIVRSIEDPLKRLDKELGAKVPDNPLSKSEVIDYIERRLGKKAKLVQISFTSLDVDRTNRVRFLTHAVNVGDRVLPMGVHTSTCHLIKEIDGSKPPKPFSWYTEFNNIGGIEVRKRVEPDEIIAERLRFSGNDDEKLLLARGIACEVEACLAREAGHRTPRSISEARTSIGRNSPQTKANKVLSKLKGE